MRMHVTQQGLQRLPLHTESEGRTILVSGAYEKVLVLDKQTPHDVGHIHAPHEGGQSELQNESVAQNLLVLGGCACLWKCFLDEWLDGVKNVILGLVLGSCDSFDCMLDNESHFWSAYNMSSSQNFLTAAGMSFSVSSNRSLVAICAIVNWGPEE